MDCERMNDRLVPYYFGASDDDERAAAREHLVACTRCLRAFLALKEHAEGGALRGLEPSEAVDARIRGDVARAIRPSPLSRARRVFAVRVPLYQVVAAAALVALAASAMALRGHPRAEPIGARVDFASFGAGEM